MRSQRISRGKANPNCDPKRYRPAVCSDVEGSTVIIRKILKIVNSINLKVCYISMVSVFVLMLLTTVNVIIRKAPLGVGGITDAFDMTNLLMVLIIFCALAFQESGREHIRVDMFVEMLPKIGKHIVNTLFDLLTVGALGFFSYVYFSDIEGTQRSGAATQVLKIPEWPFYIVIAISIALFGVTVLLNMIDRFLPEEAAGAGSEAKPEEDPS